MKKVCYICQKEIKGRPLIFDDYYFCKRNDAECKAIYIFGNNTIEKKGGA